MHSLNQYARPWLWLAEPTLVGGSITVWTWVALLLAALALVVLGGYGWRFRKAKERAGLADAITKALPFDRFFQSNPCEMWIVRLADKRILDVNLRWEEGTGYTRAEALGRTALELNLPVSLEVFDHLYEEIQQKGFVRGFELEYQGKSGERGYGLVCGERFDLDGEPCVLWANQDISARKQAEERFAKTFYATPISLTIISRRDYRIVETNPSTLQLTGLMLQEMRGKSLRELNVGISPAIWQEISDHLTATGKLSGYEFKVSYEGQDHVLLVSAEHIEFNGEPCILWSQQDITERKRVEERFTTAFFKNPTPMCISRFADNLHLAVNESYAQLTGVPQAELAGKTGKELGFIFDPVASREFRNILFETKSVRNFEIEITYRSGTRTMLVSAELLPLEGELSILWSLLDITARKQAEEALQASEARYRSLVEDQAEFVARWWPDGTRTFVNDSYCRFFEVTREEALQVSWFPAAFNVIDQTEIDQLRALTPAQPLHQVEHLTRRRNGQLTWTQWSNRAFFDEAGNIVEYQSVGRDITARKQAEEISQRWQRVFEQAEFGLAHTNAADNTLLDVNEAFASTRGYTRAELIGQPLLLVCPPERHDEMRVILQQIDRAGHYVYESVHQRKDGTQFPVLMEVTTVKDAQGRSVSRIAYALDITRRKQAEEAAQRWQSVFEQANFGLAHVNATDNTYLDVNEAYARGRGYTRAELVGQPVSILFPPHLRERSEELFRIIDQAGHYVTEGVHQHKDGSILPVLVEVHVIKDGHGQPISRIVYSLDITERKQAEAALRASEQRYRRLVEDQLDFLVRWTPDGKRTFVNDSYCRFFGLQPEEALGTSWFDLAAVAENNPVVQKLAHLSPENPIVEWEHQCLAPDGTLVWTHWINRAFFDESGRVAEFQSVGRDITERKEAEEVLRRWHSVFSQTEFGLAHTNVADAAFLDVNDAYARLRGYTREELIGQPVSMIYPPEERARIGQLIEEIDHKGKLVFETVHQRKDGTSMPVLMEITVIRDAQGHPVSRISYTSDITERKKAEAELRASREQMRNLAARLQSIREEERTAVAREIHDELGQALTGIKLGLRWLEKGLPAGADTTQARLSSVYELIGTTIQRVRQLATSLRPAVLDDFGLVAALEWQAREFETRTGIVCDLAELPPEDLDVPRDSATAIFRIFQETLTNVARHAEATRVEARLGVQAVGNAAMLRLQIHDNGRGITPDEIAHTRSLGLVGMRERALLSGGTFDIHGAPGKGTVVIVQIPLDQLSHSAE